jgi:small-conductance mechanosensitive channel
MDQEIKVVRWFSAIDWIQAGSRIAAILIITGVLIYVSRRLIAGFERLSTKHAFDLDAQRRAATVSIVLRKTATFVFSTLATLAILSTVGISIMPFLATAGVAGIAIAFGAQTLVKDFLRGFFLVAENQIRQGDVVEIAGMTGQVESLTLRYVQLRDYEGNVHYVPNGEIAVVTNTSRTYAFSVMDAMIALDQEIEPVIDIMREIAVQMRAHAEFGPKILDELEIAGIETWTERGITLRARIRVHAIDQGIVRREFLLRLKQAFDAQHIRQPQMTVLLVGSQGLAGSQAPAGGLSRPPPAKVTQ